MKLTTSIRSDTRVRAHLSTPNHIQAECQLSHFTLRPGVAFTVCQRGQLCRCGGIPLVSEAARPAPFWPESDSNCFFAGRPPLPAVEEVSQFDTQLTGESS